MIKGETVYLIEKTQTGTDAMNRPIYSESRIQVDNVLIGSPSFDQVVSDQNLYGKRLAFVLGIPKADSNNWEDCEVMIRGERFRSYGFPLTQTAENVPGLWNTQVKVELYG